MGQVIFHFRTNHSSTTKHVGLLEGQFVNKNELEELGIQYSHSIPRFLRDRFVVVLPITQGKKTPVPLDPPVLVELDPPRKTALIPEPDFCCWLIHGVGRDPTPLTDPLA